MGLLGSFPDSGLLVARAANVPTLLEPALACVLALVVTLVVLGFAAPFAVVFGLAISPIAWVLSCAGAWVAGSCRPGSRRSRIRAAVGVRFEMAALFAG